jgi:hypothetical protein
MATGLLALYVVSHPVPQESSSNIRSLRV